MQPPYMTANLRVPLTRFATFLYALGAVAYGVKESGFSYLLLPYYTQALGVPPQQVSIALAMGFVADAVTDPIIGQLTDATRTKLGRRHPWMYASVAPAICFTLLLWRPPPSLDASGLFWWLLFMAVAVRSSLTMYEIPSTSLIPELTDDYDERTKLVAIRNFFGYIGGIAMLVTTNAVFLTESSPGANDPLAQPAGYRAYSTAAVVVITASILICAGGTHAYIPHLRAAPPRQPCSGWRMGRELREAISTRSFGAIFGASLLFGLASGVSSNLTQIILIYFWGLNPKGVALLIASFVVSAVASLALAPLATRRCGKRRGALLFGLMGVCLAPLPVLVRLLCPSCLPANGSAALLALLLVFNAVDFTFMVSMQITIQSMVADLVEDAELRNGRRAEGIVRAAARPNLTPHSPHSLPALPPPPLANSFAPSFAHSFVIPSLTHSLTRSPSRTPAAPQFFAASTFGRKAVTAFGTIGAGMILHASGFDADDPTSATRLARLYVPVVMTANLLGVVVLSRYRIDRAMHTHNVEALSRMAADSDTKRLAPTSAPSSCDHTPPGTPLDGVITPTRPCTEGNASTELVVLHASTKLSAYSSTCHPDPDAESATVDQV